MSLLRYPLTDWLCDELMRERFRSVGTSEWQRPYFLDWETWAIVLAETQEIRARLGECPSWPYSDPGVRYDNFLFMGVPICRMVVS